jgi:RNA-binding protein 8A
MNLDRRTGYTKGYAFIEFEQAKEGKEAIEAMNGQLLIGKKINVDWAFRRPTLSDREGAGDSKGGK